MGFVVSMAYEECISEKLSTISAQPGDRIKIVRKDKQFEGSLMPHHEFSGKEIVTLKLDNGYNIGISVSSDDVIELVKKSDVKQKSAKTIPFDESKDTIAVIGTGGTIACYIDYRTGAVHPATSSSELAFSIPEVFDVCNLKTQVAYQLLSEHITPDHWKTLAERVAVELNSGVRGVVIPHGTDTMGYTAAALSFMLGDCLPAPVVFVGAQRSSDRPSSDAAQNLMDAAIVASKSDIGEVVVVMHESSSDSRSLIHRGTRVRKCHTSRRDAFKTINNVPLGVVDGHEIILNREYRKTKAGVKVKASVDLEQSVAMMYSFPGIDEADIPKNKKGLVILGTGLGHIPDYILPKVKQLVSDGVVVVMATQCLFGRTNMSVYSTGRDQLKAGIISCEDMLPETAYVKLMWALANCKGDSEVKALMAKDLVGEISNRSASDAFF